MCLGNISKDWPVDNMNRAGFNGYVYNFSVAYDDIEVENIKDIHKYEYLFFFWWRKII